MRVDKIYDNKVYRNEKIMTDPAAIFFPVSQKPRKNRPK